MCFLAAAVVAFFAIVVVDARPPAITSMLPCSAKSLKNNFSFSRDEIIGCLI